MSEVEKNEEIEFNVEDGVVDSGPVCLRLI